MCAVDTLVKVLKEAETAELVVEQDPIGAILSQRAAAGKRWQDQARTLMANLKVSLSCQEEEGYHKILPANMANQLCQSWQPCSNHHEVRAVCTLHTRATSMCAVWIGACMCTRPALQMRDLLLDSCTNLHQHHPALLLPHVGLSPDTCAAHTCLSSVGNAGAGCRLIL